MRADNQMLRTINAQRGERSWLDFVVVCAGAAGMLVWALEVLVRSPL